MAEVFGAGTFAGSGVEDAPLIQQLEGSYAAAIVRESDDKLAAALANKAQAALACRAYRLGREAALLKARVAMARGQPATFPTEGPTELRQLAKWRRARQFVCLVCEEVPGSSNSSSSSDGSTGNGSSSSSSSGRQLLGTATISLMQAEAALPPPFPSSAPLRAYISNMAVSPSARRRGVGRALCCACGRVALAWGQPRLLLHVAADNGAAQALYASCGFATEPNSQGLSGLVKGPWTQQRMAADAAQLAGQYRRHMRRGTDAVIL